MMVFWNERLVLLSVPKTGTHAYMQALAHRASVVVSDPPELKHAPLYRYNRFFRPMFEKMGASDLELMAVIREPVSWLGSWYRYRQRPALDGRPTSTKDVAFDAFLEACCDPSPPPFANVGNQAKFVETRPNGTAVRHFFRYEDQPGIQAFLTERLGTLPAIPDANVSPRMPLEISPRIENQIKQARASEFALWESIPVRETPAA